MPSEQQQPQPSEKPATPPTPRRRIVSPGDSLWKISEEVYGHGRYWNDIWTANLALIGADPHALNVGIELILPDEVEGS
ncbi:LysM peptidoglycan-binding domain-containing protein [Nonomuraea recticatena]